MREHFRAVQSWLLCAQWRVLHTVHYTLIIAECTVCFHLFALHCYVESEEVGVVGATAGLSPLSSHLGPWILGTKSYVQTP